MKCIFFLSKVIVLLAQLYENGNPTIIFSLDCLNPEGQLPLGYEY